MNKVRVAVIGSGFGGLAVAIRLQSAGFQTVLYEKRDKPGGCAYVYHDQGFTFDAGPTVVTAPACLEELFQLSGRRMEDYIQLSPVAPFCRFFWEDGYQLDYSNDTARLLDQIRKKSPEDVDGYKKLLDYSKTVFKEGYEKLAHIPFLNWWSMLRVTPLLIRLSAHQSIYKTVSSYIRDPQLRQAFCFRPFLVGGNPSSSSLIFNPIHYIEKKWGVFFPKGGTGALVTALVRLFAELGGEIELGTPIERIVTHDGKVTGIETQEGRLETFAAVVSNADVVHTYHSLLAQEPLASRPAKRARAMAHSLSFLLIYFGSKKKYPSLAHHNVIFGAGDKEPLSGDFPLTLHAPTLLDPTLAPEGCEALHVLLPVPHLGKVRIDWKGEGPRYTEKILNYLDERYMPDLKKNLVTTRIFTPEDFKTELNAHLGSAFSLETVLNQSAYFRIHNRDANIKGLYFVGAGTHPGAGVPGVVGSAKITAKLIVKDFKSSSPDDRVQIMSWGKQGIRNPKSELDWATAGYETGGGHET